MKYRVKVETVVVVEARNKNGAKAIAEQGVRFAVNDSYKNVAYPGWADAWEGFGFQAKGCERYEDGTDE